MTIPPELSEFLSLLAQGLLVIALPILIAAGVQALRIQAQKLGDDRLSTIMTAVRMAVALAEQTGLDEALNGPEKRAAALRTADAFLRRRGITLDLEELADLIESEVLLQFNNPTVLEDTPQTRQSLIQNAIEAAVLAAEQAGLAGFIENIGIKKKAHAQQVAAQYLDEVGIDLPDELTSSLIEAQVLRFKLGVRGQLPGSTVTAVIQQQPVRR